MHLRILGDDAISSYNEAGFFERALFLEVFAQVVAVKLAAARATFGTEPTGRRIGVVELQFVLDEHDGTGEARAELWQISLRCVGGRRVDCKQQGDEQKNCFHS